MLLPLKCGFHDSSQTMKSQALWSYPGVTAWYFYLGLYFLSFSLFLWFCDLRNFYLWVLPSYPKVSISQELEHLSSASSDTLHSSFVTTYSYWVSIQSLLPSDYFHPKTRSRTERFPGGRREKVWWNSSTIEQLKLRVSGEEIGAEDHHLLIPVLSASWIPGLQGPSHIRP